jgi:N-sulfoglucosamine sulfohydrolase
MPKAPGTLGGGGARSGESSTGWLSDWHLKEGASRVVSEDLELKALSSSSGLTISKGKTVVMRQMAETFTGTAYGSFRVRASKLNPNSMMGLMIGLPNAEPMRPSTSFITFLVTRWASELGGLVIGGKPFKVDGGVGIQEAETALVLWRMKNLPEPGKKADQRIDMWILSAEQAAFHTAAGMQEQALEKAKAGRLPNQVLQSVSVELDGSQLTLVKGLVVSCFSTGVPKAAFDEIRISKESLADAAGVTRVPERAVGATKRANSLPNILFITLDDMNWDSMGAYGCPIPEITPHMDTLAAEGMRFEFAYNQTSSCVPSRNTYQTGRYPHNSGVLSFFNVRVDFLTLPEILRREGYRTGCINKPRDTSITNDFAKYWDYHPILMGAEKRDASTYRSHLNEFLGKVDGQPFYCVVNIADPHKPFYDDPEGIEQGFNTHAPSIRYDLEDVTVPGFLPDVPEIHEEIQNYYNSVKRADDCVGAVLETLRESGFADDTVVILVSDHGMPLPFAKSSLYADGIRTPWVIRWPGRLSAGQVDSKHLVSAIDFLPTVLDIVGVDIPEGAQGRSVLPVVFGGSVDGLDRVFAEFNDNAGGLSFPMRAVHTKEYVYIFNAWGSGNQSFSSAATWHRSESVMKRLAQSDPNVAKRYQFLKQRCVEEFYDLKKDPFALENLIAEPAYQEVIIQARAEMKGWMEQTDDYVLEAFLLRDDLSALDAWMETADAAALTRAQTLQWKRYKNRAGGTGQNTLLYDHH